MSNFTRWFSAFFLIVLGIASALFSLGFLGFFSWGCYELTNDISMFILYVAATVGVIGGIVPAIMLIRKTAGKSVAIAIALSFVITLGCNGVYIFYTLNIC